MPPARIRVQFHFIQYRVQSVLFGNLRLYSDIPTFLWVAYFASIVFVLLEQTYLQDIPGRFYKAHEFGEVAVKLLLSYIGSFTFYLLLTHRKDRKKILANEAFVRDQLVPQIQKYLSYMLRICSIGHWPTGVWDAKQDYLPRNLEKLLIKVKKNEGHNQWEARLEYLRSFCVVESHELERILEALRVKEILLSDYALGEFVTRVVRQMKVFPNTHHRLTEDEQKLVQHLAPSLANAYDQLIQYLHSRRYIHQMHFDEFIRVEYPQITTPQFIIGNAANRAQA